ncbi:MAG TPA: zf-HC2 domain-containing protein [Streptosporangiaceae bacterium]|nr:zf-HC2 domain-containing protein [Streptosporangiaceae bacterium]
MRGHVDEQTLAAYREGLLPAREAARIAAHLPECPRCAEIDAQLAAVTTILARTPAPPMPASVAQRLDAALAAEIAAASQPGAFPAGAVAPAGPVSPARAGAGATPAGTPPTGAPVPGERAGRLDGPGGQDGTGRRRAGPARAPWRLSLRLAAVAAAVVVVAGGGYAIAHTVLAGNSAVSSSSASEAAPAGAPSATGRVPEAAPGAAIGAGLPLVVSGTDYRSGQLPAQVGAVLKRYPAAALAPGRVRALPTVPVSVFPRLAACVAHVAGGQRPRLVDIARYGGQPAAVIVVPVPGTATVRVSVVGPGCPAQGGGIITQFSMPAPG